MPTPTYDLITEQTANGSTSSITFGSGGTLTQLYKDLVLEIAGNTVNGGTQIQFNGDTGTNYSRTGLRGDGSTATSFRQTSQNAITFDGSYSQPGRIFIVHIMSYSNGSVNKTVLSRSDNAGAGIDQCVGLWRSNSAITSMVVSGINWTSGTTFRLWGVSG